MTVTLQLSLRIKLEVKDKYGIPAYENGRLGKYNFNLVQGYYTFNLYLENKLINTTSQFIQNDASIIFDSNDNHYAIELNLRDHQSSIPDLLIHEPNIYYQYL